MSHLLKHFHIIVVLAIGSLLSFWLFHYIDQKSQDAVKQRFIFNANDRLFAIEKNIESEIAKLKSIVGLYAASENVTRAEFSHFVNVMSENKGVHSFQALEWIPRVTMAARENYEALAQKDGFEKFQITERSKNGDLIAVAERPEYFPVYYVEPVAGNELALGFDLGSNPVRKIALAKARDSAQMITSGRINLVQLKEDKTGVLIFYPIYTEHKPHASVDQRRQNLKGFVLGVVKVNSLISGHYYSSNDNISASIGIDVYAYDMDAPIMDTPLYIQNSQGGTGKASSLSLKNARSGSYVERVIRIGDRHWSIIARPYRPDFGYVTLIQNWILLLAGQVITLLLAAYMFALSTRARSVASLVNTRTQELQQSEQRWQFALEGSQDGVWDWDVKTNVVFYSRQWKAMLGYKENEISNRLEEWEKRVHPDDKERVYADLKKHMSGQLPYYQNEHRVQRKNGAYIWILDRGKVVEWDENGQPSRVIGTHSDVSERKSAEQAQQKTETQRRTILETVADAIISIDEKGIIQMFNPAAERMFGYRDTEAIGKNVSMLVPEADRNTHEGYTTNSKLNSPRIINQGRELQGRRKNGFMFPLELNISPMQLEGDHGFVGILRDITERKKNEYMLQEATAEAEAANRVKSGFLATMSHEIRTPMNAVLGVLGLLKDASLNKQQLQLIRTGRESGELLLTIINDILDFSKMEADKLQLECTGFDLHRLLKYSIELLKHQADNNGLKLELNLAPDLPRYAKGDPDRLRQILINLINNAIKFTPSGSISISATSDLVSSKNFQLCCAVQDTGIGISKNLQTSLFEEFSMADQSHSRHYEGTGLGLAICKRLVSLMRGNIGCDSEPGKGSTFTFTIELDVAQEHECESERSLDEPQWLPAANTRILLAEDNPANQMVIKSILQYADLQVDIVANGREAVEAVRSLPYDIVLMDISMPDMDGMTATGKIRQLPGQQSKIPIVALTAHSLSGDREHFLEAGMDDYLSKPIDRATMLHCIARWTGAVTATQPQVSPVISLADTSQAEIEIESESESESLDPYVDPFVDENVLQQLVRDTASEIVPELLAFYIEDARKRTQQIQTAIIERDIKNLEYESHTLGSSAAAHGNAKLHALARKVEHLCQAADDEQALAEAVLLSPVAEESFRLLAERADKGFEIVKKAGNYER